MLPFNECSRASSAALALHQAQRSIYSTAVVYGGRRFCATTPFCSRRGCFVLVVDTPSRGFSHTPPTRPSLARPSLFLTGTHRRTASLSYSLSAHPRHKSTQPASSVNTRGELNKRATFRLSWIFCGYFFSLGGYFAPRLCTPVDFYTPYSSARSVSRAGFPSSQAHTRRTVK